MADLNAICEEIAEAIKTIPGNDAVVHWEQINPPVSIVEPQGIDYTNAMRGGEKLDISVRVLIADASKSASSKERMEFFGGAKAFKDAIENHAPLIGDVAQQAFVRSAQNFGVWEISGISYVGGEFSLDVYA